MADLFAITVKQKPDTNHVGGRKIWEFPKKNGSKYVTVFHHGNHTCPAVKTYLPIKDDISSVYEKNEKTMASKIKKNAVPKFLDESNGGEIKWCEVDEAANAHLDTKHIKYVNKTTKQSLMSTSFDAVAKLHEKVTGEDAYFIYSMNNGKMNNGKPTYAFKTSKAKLQLGKEMDRSCESLLCKEYALFYGNHKRCPGYVTLTLWVVHPLLGELVNLATIEVTKKATDNISLFWEL